AWNNARKRLGHDKSFVYILSRQVVSEIGRKDKSVLGDVPPDEVERIGCLVFLDRAADVAIPEQVLVWRQRRRREQRASCVELLIIELRRQLAVNSVGAWFRENLDAVVTWRIVLCGVWIRVDADFAN